MATAGIGALGKAAAPILVAVVVVSAAVLAVLALRSRVAASLGVAALGAVALLAAFAEPFIAPLATVLTVLGALAAGTLVSGLLLRSSQTPSRRSALEPFSGRYREAHTGGGMAVNRRGFLALAGGTAAEGAAAAGTGRFLTGEEDAEIAGARPLKSTQRGGHGQAVPKVRTSVPPPPPEASIEVPGMHP